MTQKQKITRAKKIWIGIDIVSILVGVFTAVFLKNYLGIPVAFLAAYNLNKELK